MHVLTKCFVVASVNFILNISVMAGTPAPANAEVYIVAPADGATVSGPINVIFGLKNMGVAPAGVDQANTGHHHLLINVATTPALDQPIPSNDQHKHFGGGQTETTITLPPGKHTLQLLLADKLHVPHTPAVMSKKISITVK